MNARHTANHHEQFWQVSYNHIINDERSSYTFPKEFAFQVLQYFQDIYTLNPWPGY